MSTADDSLTFLASWFDKLAASDRPFRFAFYPVDNSIEIYDLRSKKMHLKRIRHEAISLNDLFVGNTLDIYGRRFKITEFADTSTKEQLYSKKERTFLMVKPDAYTNIGKIVEYMG